MHSNLSLSFNRWALGTSLAHLQHSRVQMLPVAVPLSTVHKAGAVKPELCCNFQQLYWEWQFSTSSRQGPVVSHLSMSSNLSLTPMQASPPRISAPEPPPSRSEAPTPLAEPVSLEVELPSAPQPPAPPPEPSVAATPTPSEPLVEAAKQPPAPDPQKEDRAARCVGGVLTVCWLGSSLQSLQAL